MLKNIVKLFKVVPLILNPHHIDYFRLGYRVRALAGARNKFISRIEIRILFRLLKRVKILPIHWKPFYSS